MFIVHSDSRYVRQDKGEQRWGHYVMLWYYDIERISLFIIDKIVQHVWPGWLSDFDKEM